MNNLNELILTTKLKNQLNMFVTEPNTIPRYTLLYGEPGTGKTSFAKFFAKKSSNEYFYFACNEGLGKNQLANIESILRTRSLLNQSDCEIDKVIVIDEFHNASKKEQERFKTLYDDLDDTVKLIFILNTNSSSKGYKTLPDILSTAMISRCYSLCFDISLDEVNEVVNASKKVYENLDEETIYRYLPDHRVLERMNGMAQFNSV
jgi:replication-associated recombination protein RarA